MRACVIRQTPSKHYSLHRGPAKVPSAELARQLAHLEHSLGQGGAGLWLHGTDDGVHLASQLLPAGSGCVYGVWVCVWNAATLIAHVMPATPSRNCSHTPQEGERKARKVGAAA